jgi:FKBP-type peptidyl-prolyl cis-trans isomerase 2
VVSADQEHVNVDLNHPLAGKRLTFDVKIHEVREPRFDEIPATASGCGCGTQEQARAVVRGVRGSGGAARAAAAAAAGERRTRG